VYAAVPPDANAVALPVDAPLHKTLEVADMLTVSGVGLTRLFDNIAVHPSADVTVTVYVPAASPDKSSIEEPFDQTNAYGVVPPEGVISIAPVAPPEHKGLVNVAFTESEFATFTDIDVGDAQSPAVGVKL
jgi:hypothetical protein